MQPIKTVFTILLSLAMLAGLAQPVLAEAPPPPDDGAATAGNSSSPPASNEDEAEEAGPDDDAPLPPAAAPDAVAGAVQALYQADGALTDLNGNPVPLAADLAARALTDFDPQGCPAGVLPTWMGGSGSGCTSNYATIAGAIADAKVKAGWTVFAQAGSYPEGGLLTVNKSITVRGQNFATTSIDALVSLTSPNITLRDFTINGGVLANGQSGLLRLDNLFIDFPGNIGVNILNHNGSLQLNRVTSSRNWQGAVLTATSPSGTITITNSNFDYCSGAGSNSCLSISTPGAVKLDKVSASHNQHGSGAVIGAGTSIGITNSTFSFNRNGVVGDSGGFGLHIHDSGAASRASLSSVTSQGNEESGALISVDGNINIQKSNFLYNTRAGLDVTTTAGLVTLNSLNVMGNSVKGAVALANGAAAVTASNSTFIANGDVALSLTSGGNITLSNLTVAGTPAMAQGIFANNAGLPPAGTFPTITATNLHLQGPGNLAMQLTSRGKVTLNHVQASGFTGLGVMVDNCWLAGPACQSSKDVSVSSAAGPSYFNNNGSHGLSILSGGHVTISSTAANNNTAGEGIHIENDRGAGNVSLSRVETLRNAMAGIFISTSGAATLTSVTASNNVALGLVLFKSPASPAKSATITHGVFEANQGSGVLLNWIGPVTFNHALINDNFSAAGFITNTLGGVSIVNTSGANQFDRNGGGLTITTQGAVTVRGASLSNNAGSALLINDTLAGTISLSSLTINSNMGAALNVTGLGAITVNNLRAAHNSSGAVLINTGAATALPVSVSNTSITASNSNGLIINSKGATTLNHLTITDNIGQALNVTSGQDVFILNSSGANAFDRNAAGVVITAQGVVTVKGATINSNNGNGLQINNTLAGAINLSSLTVDSNSGMGINATGQGLIAVNNVRVTSNGNGIALSNMGAATAQKITINHGVFSANNGNGLIVVTKGDAIFNHLTINNNNGVGASITGLAGFSLLNTLGANSISGNLGSGLSLTANGVVTLKGATISRNGGAGLQINDALDGGAVTLSSVSADYNAGQGIRLVGRGAVTLSSVSASSNTGESTVYNADASLTPGISLTNSVFSQNKSWGMTLTSKGDVKLTHVHADGNMLHGMAINTCKGGPCIGIGTVTISSGSTFDRNGVLGLDVDSGGKISLSGVSASGNMGPLGARLSTGNINLASPVSKDITVSSSNFNQNGGMGLTITGKGLVTLSSVNANQNRSFGINADNVQAGTGNLMTLNKVQANYNALNGLVLFSLSALTLNGIGASYNGGHGLFLDNYQGGAGVGNVQILSTLGSNNFNNNKDMGLSINPAGSLTISKVKSMNNGQAGLFLAFRPNNTATITCGTFTGNGLFGFDIAGGAASNTLTLKGVIVGGNQPVDWNPALPPPYNLVVQTASCP